jgi:acid phosphatase family membrane protein YuiD
MYLIPVIVALLTQITKSIFERSNKKDALTKMGGFPSSHSAMVTSLLIVVHSLDGAHQSTFIIAFIFALIVIHDAFRLRLQIEKQGEAIKDIQDALPEENIAYAHQSSGHHFHEVVGGILFGACFTYVLLIIF